MGSVVPPIFQNSLFTALNVEARSRRGERYIYTRESNPTTDVLNAEIAAMEGLTRHGASHRGWQLSARR